MELKRLILSSKQNSQFTQHRLTPVSCTVRSAECVCVCVKGIVQLQSCSGICVSGLLLCTLDGCWRGAHAPYRYVAADNLALTKAANSLKYALRHGSPRVSVHRRCMLGTVVKELDKQPFSYVRISYIFITAYPREIPCLASRCCFPALLSMTKQPTHTICCEMNLAQHKTTMRYKTDLQRALIQEKTAAVWDPIANQLQSLPEGQTHTGWLYTLKNKGSLLASVVQEEPLTSIETFQCTKGYFRL